MNQDQSPKINPSSTELANIYKFSQVRHFKIIATCIMLYIFLLQIGDVFIVLHFIENFYWLQLFFCSCNTIFMQ